MSATHTYPGEELELFQHAVNWKRYFSTAIRPFIGPSVLEVGAGIGSNTSLLFTDKTQHWLLLEPDETMFAVLKKKIADGVLPARCRCLKGTTEHVQQQFDTILYIDVLEHIEKDGEELERAAGLLAPGGHLVVLSPAFPVLYSPFDKVIGHYRRYTRKMIRSVTPAGLTLTRNRYYDSVGFFAGLVNRLFLKQRYPTQQQVFFWDRWMVPVSRVTDLLCFYSFGKSIISVWKKPVQDL